MKKTNDYNQYVEKIRDSATRTTSDKISLTMWFHQGLPSYLLKQVLLIGINNLEQMINIVQRLKQSLKFEKTLYNNQKDHLVTKPTEKNREFPNQQDYQKLKEEHNASIATKLATVSTTA
jgi:hypothetical protein